MGFLDAAKKLVKDAGDALDKVPDLSKDGIKKIKDDTIDKGVTKIKGED